MFERVKSLFQGAILESGAEITLGQLPVVQGNRSQLSLVAQNLIGNALKYRSSRPLQIHVAGSCLQPDCVITVKDNGIGFDPAYSQQIFGLFKRLKKTNSPGTGLGLAICKRVIENHGGKIWAESQPDQGSTFFFSLPDRDWKSSSSDRASAYPQQVPA